MVGVSENKPPCPVGIRTESDEASIGADHPVATGRHDRAAKGLDRIAETIDRDTLGTIRVEVVEVNVGTIGVRREILLHYLGKSVDDAIRANRKGGLVVAVALDEQVALGDGGESGGVAGSNAPVYGLEDKPVGSGLGQGYAIRPDY